MSTDATLHAQRIRGTDKLLKVDDAIFQKDFGNRPFRMTHNLVDHPLLKIPRLIELAVALPEENVEYNAGDIPVNSALEKTPQTGLSMEETIRRIEQCRSWMVLKNVELESEYRRLMLACLGEIFSHTPIHPDVVHREAFIFISSPGAVTPFHMDPEFNFLLQVHGTKQMHIFPGSDRTLVPEEALERAYSGASRNLAYRDEFEKKASTFELQAGDCVHVPANHPHWVKVGDGGYSISLSITFRTRGCDRLGFLYAINHEIRQRGGNPKPVGQSPLRDTFVYATHRIRRRLRSVVGRLETTA